MYAEARKIFSEYPADPVAGGYALMCDVKMKSNGYETRLAKYISMFPIPDSFRSSDMNMH